MNRAYNFAAGPAMLPEEVIRGAQAAVGDFGGRGISLLELGHRTPVFEGVVLELKARIKSLLSVPDDYDIIFCPGGGRMQFSMVPLNLTTQGCRGGYVVTGIFSKAASEEARRISRETTLWSGSGRDLPKNVIRLPRSIDFVYFCDNETADGIEFRGLPAVDRLGAVFAADMTSNFMSRPVDVRRYGVIWAGVQKNFGTAGLACVIVRRSLLGNAGPKMPMLLNWANYARTDSLPNTPPVLQFYVSLLMARWIEKEGGVAEMASRAEERSSMLYEAVDAMADFYVGAPEPGVRSRMNAVFTLADETLLPEFLRDAAEEGLLNLAGHRQVGGIRVSMYNAMPAEGVARLVDFMKRFAGRHVHAK